MSRLKTKGHRTKRQNIQTKDKQTGHSLSLLKETGEGLIVTDKHKEAKQKVVSNKTHQSNI